MKICRTNVYKITEIKYYISQLKIKITHNNFNSLKVSYK